MKKKTKKERNGEKREQQIGKFINENERMLVFKQNFIIQSSLSNREGLKKYEK